MTVKNIADVMDKTLMRFGKGRTPEQRERNQRNLVALRKMIDAARIDAGVKKINQEKM